MANPGIPLTGSTAIGLF